MNGSKAKMLRRLARTLSPEGIPYAVGAQGDNGNFVLSSSCTKKIGQNLKNNNRNLRPWRHLEERNNAEA